MLYDLTVQQSRGRPSAYSEKIAAEVCERLAAGEQLAGSLHDGELKQHTYPTPEEFRAFAMKGLNLIDLKEYASILRRFGFHDESPRLEHADLWGLGLR